MSTPSQTMFPLPDRCRVLILSVDESLDEIVIVVGDQRLVCFGFGQATASDVGREFSVTLRALEIDGLPIEPLAPHAPDLIRRTNQAYGYEVHGTLINGQLRACGIVIADEGEESLPPGLDHLEGQRIRCIVDRLDIELHR